MKRRLINSAAFGWIWADMMSLNTSAFIQLIPSCVTSRATKDPVPVMHAQAITLPPPCFTDVVLFTFHHSHTGWAGVYLSKECLSRTVLAFLDVFFFFEWLASSSEPSVFAFIQSSLYGRLGYWYAYLQENVVHLLGCWKGFSSPWKWFSAYPSTTVDFWSVDFWITEFINAFFLSQTVDL